MNNNWKNYNGNNPFILKEIAKRKKQEALEAKAATMTYADFNDKMPKKLKRIIVRQQFEKWCENYKEPKEPKEIKEYIILDK